VKALWLTFVIGAAGVALIEILALIKRRAEQRFSRGQRPLFAPTRSQRVLYRMGSAVFILSPFAAFWIATLIAPVRQWLAAAMLVTAVLWILIGAIPAVVAVARG
jgi:hypothetical protein